MIKTKNIQIMSVIRFLLGILTFVLMFTSISFINSYAVTVTNSVEINGINVDTSFANNSAEVTDVICPNHDIDGITFARVLPDTGEEITNGNIQFAYTLRNDGIDTIEQIFIKIEYYKGFTGTMYGSHTTASIDQNSVPETLISGSGTTELSDDRYSVTLRVYDISIPPLGTITVDINGVGSNALNETEGISSIFRSISVDAYADIPFASPIPECTTTDTYNSDSLMTGGLTHLIITDISIVKTSSGGGNSSTANIGELFAGGNVAYTMSITNNGVNTAIEPLTVIDTFPSQVTPTDLGGGVYTNSPNWTCSFSAPTMTCVNYNSLPPSGTTSVVINGTVNQNY